ncbi:MAG: hypothetical protein RI897_1361 [Verrucomicrobiota bacterium]|jgi:cell division protein FtsB
MPAMQVDLGIWTWLNRAIVVLLVVAAIIGLGAWYVPRLQDNEALRLTIYDLEQELGNELQTSNLLSAQITASKDPRQIIRWLRESQNWARTNETVIRFVEPNERRSRR